MEKHNGILQQHGIGWVVRDNKGNEFNVSPSQMNIENIYKFEIEKKVDFIIENNYAWVIWLEN